MTRLTAFQRLTSRSQGVCSFYSRPFFSFLVVQFRGFFSVCSVANRVYTYFFLNRPAGCERLRVPHLKVPTVLIKCGDVSMSRMRLYFGADCFRQQKLDKRQSFGANVGTILTFLSCARSYRRRGELVSAIRFISTVWAHKTEL